MKARLIIFVGLIGFFSIFSTSVLQNEALSAMHVIVDHGEVVKSHWREIADGTTDDWAGPYKKDSGHPALVSNPAQMSGMTNTLTAPVPTTTSSTAPPQSGAVDLSGEWSINANNFRGKMTIMQQGRLFTGTIFGNKLIEGIITGNVVTFTRDISQIQHYTGTLTVAADGSVTMTGTFTQNSTGSYKWTAVRTGVANTGTTTTNTAPSQTSTLPTMAPQSGAVDLSGEWSINANSTNGKMTIVQQGMRFTGTIFGGPLIEGIITSNVVTFTRDISPVQHYTGTLTVAADGSVTMTGTFTVNRSGSYKWTAVKTGATTTGTTTTASSPTATLPTSTPQSGAVDLSGEWSINANNFRGKMTIVQQGTRFTGTILGSPLIDGIITGNAVSFIRDISQIQHYTGTLTVAADGSATMTGTFTVNKSGSYKWTAVKTGVATTGTTPTTTPGRFTVEAGKRKLSQGGTVTVPVSLNNVEALANMNVNIHYDPTVVRPVRNAARGNIIPQSLFEANVRDRGVVRLGFAQKADILGTGTLGQITFEAVGRPGTRTPLRLEVIMASTSAGSRVTPAQLIHGEITIVGTDGRLPGDTSGTGDLTALDAMNALKMSVGNLSVDMVADIDQDSSVTARDATLILQQVVGRP